MATGVVVGSILLAADQQLRVEERAVGASADLINRRGVEIDEERARDMLSTTGLSEEGLEGAGIANVLGVRVGTTISTKAMLQEVAVMVESVRRNVMLRVGALFRVDVQLPSRVTQLGTSLADVEVKNLWRRRVSRDISGAIPTGEIRGQSRQRSMRPWSGKLAGGKERKKYLALHIE